MSGGTDAEALRVAIAYAVEATAGAHERTAAILHGTAVSAVLCAAYVGFDRASREASAQQLDNDCKNAMDDAAVSALADSTAILDFVRNRFARAADRSHNTNARAKFVLYYYLLRYVQRGDPPYRATPQPGLEWAACTAFQHLKLPLLNFFRSGWNISIVMGLALVTMTSFLIIVGDAVRSPPVIPSMLELQLVYDVIVASVATVFLLGALRIRLSSEHIQRSCKVASGFLKDTVPAVREGWRQTRAQMDAALQAVDELIPIQPAGADSPPQGVAVAASEPSADQSTRNKILTAIQEGKVRQFDSTVLDAFRNDLGNPGDFEEEIRKLVADRHIAVDGATFRVTELGRKFVAALPKTSLK